MKFTPFLTAILSLTAVLSCTCSAQVFNDFEAGTVGAEYGFQEPRFSGSTSTNLALAPNIFQVLQGFDSNTTKVGQWQLSFTNTTASQWVRLTTAGAVGVPNPTVDLNQWIQFDIFSLHDIELALGIRESSDVNGPVGANGGTTGTIEWVGADRASGGAATEPGGISITGGSWHTVAFNLKGDPTFAFTGNGVVDGDWGTLESLAISALGDLDHTIYVDNFQVVPVPEPAAYACVFGAVALGAAFIRRRTQKTS